MNPDLDALAGELGIARAYRDGAGRDVRVSDETIIALISAFGLDAGSAAATADALAALRAGRAARNLPSWAVVEASRPAEVPLLRPGMHDWRLELEDGGFEEGRAERAIPIGPLPAGYHWLSVNGERMVVLSAPAQLGEVPRGWGVMVPLYGLKPVGQGGIGSYRDLADAVESLAGIQARFVGINPIHAEFTGDAGHFSPYSPTSRERFATHHIALPASDAAGPDGALIDYASCLPAQWAALDAAFEEFVTHGGSAAFDRWRAAEGDDLDRFATHQALAERYGPYWPDWPAPFRRPTSSAVSAFAAENPDRITAHAWRQWMAESQLGDARDTAHRAGMRHGLYLDLAVGTHPAGAETWADPELFAQGVSQGAPPDAFAPEGQNWNLAPMRPDVLAERGFAPLASILRRQLRFAGILRIDHILGFDRGYWVPQGLPGSYVTMPKAALMAVVRIEAQRAGAVVVGEDLGAVPEGLRDDMASSGILGCRVAMFERNWETGDFLGSECYPSLAIASFGSHDLPLWAGWREGRDIDWRVRLNGLSAEEAQSLREERQSDIDAFDAAAGTQDGGYAGVAHFLARSGAVLVAAQIEDLLGAKEQPNLPGTIHEHPNWRRRLTIGPRALADVSLVTETAAVMARCGR